MGQEPDSDLTPRTQVHNTLVGRRYCFPTTTLRPPSHRLCVYIVCLSHLQDTYLTKIAKSRRMLVRGSQLPGTRRLVLGLDVTGLMQGGLRAADGGGRQTSRNLTPSPPTWLMECARACLLAWLLASCVVCACVCVCSWVGLLQRKQPKKA